MNIEQNTENIRLNIKGIFVKANPAERTAKPIRTILSFSTSCRMTFVVYIHSFLTRDFWITFLLMVLCKEKFFIRGQIEKLEIYDNIFAHVSYNFMHWECFWYLWRLWNFIYILVNTKWWWNPLFYLRTLQNLSVSWSCTSRLWIPRDNVLFSST